MSVTPLSAVDACATATSCRLLSRAAYVTPTIFHDCTKHNAACSLVLAALNSGLSGPFQARVAG